MADTLLDVKDIHVFYGNIEAVKGMSFRVDRGEIVCLIGANGAGKTTTLRTVSGLLRPGEGAIFYEGQRIDLLPAHEIVGLGVAQSPEGRRIFPRMSVRENLDMGAFIRRDAAGQREDMDRIMDLFPILKERARQAAGTLSGGEQQMLAMGRALMARP
ncbi:MAG TPA: ABC transporter ATP-binding protein, partial [Actinomycetota bacterium]|nr:ABC transporter ATP-binding protein [Actinomycetota bacterium]